MMRENNFSRAFFSELSALRKYRNFKITIFLLILERSLYNHGFAMVGVFFTACVYVLAGEQRQY